MLLYVDKKKQRRQRIKKIFSVGVVFFVIFANVVCFRGQLDATEKSLTNFQAPSVEHLWYDVAEVVTVFKAKNSHSQVILIPQIINRENAMTIALAFSQLPLNIGLLRFTKDVHEKEFLQNLAFVFTKEKKNDDEINESMKVFVSTDINSVLGIIQTEKLYPTTLNYQHTLKLNNMAELMFLINERFPLPVVISEKIKQEQKSLEKFANQYAFQLKSIIEKEPQLSFVDRLFFLRNVSVCILTESDTFCYRDGDKSILYNIKQALLQIPNNQRPQKLVLLTSLFDLPINTILEEDDGVLFTYGERQVLLLPEQRKDILIENTYEYLKEKAGINPRYDASEMKFYKFKIVEIDVK